MWLRTDTGQLLRMRRLLLQPLLPSQMAPLPLREVCPLTSAICRGDLRTVFALEQLAGQDLPDDSRRAAMHRILAAADKKEHP